MAEEVDDRDVPPAVARATSNQIPEESSENSPPTGVSLDDHQAMLDEKRNSMAITDRRTVSVKHSGPGGVDDKRASTRITKAFARFMGKENVKDRANFAVDLGELLSGRLGLPAGRFGRVIALYEEELSTVIAYSLASHEYADQIQSFLKEDTSDVIAKGKTELSSPADFAEPHLDFFSGYANQTGAVESKEGRDDISIYDNIEQTKRTGSIAGVTPPNFNREGVLGNADAPAPLPPPAVATTKRPTFKLKSLVGGGGTSNSDAAAAAAAQSASQKEAVEEDEEGDNDRNLDDDAQSTLPPLGFVGFSTSSMNFKSKARRGTGFLSSSELEDVREKLSPQPGQHAGDSEGQTDDAIMGGASSVPRMDGHDASSIFSGSYEERGSEAAESNASDYSVREATLISQRKTHIKHRFSDMDDKNNITCKFICHTFWATQFQALRAEYLDDDDDEGYIRSLSLASRWNAQGGKSGASFSRTTDNRFVVKHITRTELQMFLDFAPAYFEYMGKAFYHGLPTTLCKILGVYQIGFHNRITGKKVMEQVVVMENLFFEVSIHFACSAVAFYIFIELCRETSLVSLILKEAVVPDTSR